MPVTIVVHGLHVHPKPTDVYMGSQVVVGFFIIDLNKVQGERPHEADVSAERFPYSQILIKCSIYCKVKEK